MPGNETNEPPSNTEPTPADIFALVGHETRADIIQALVDADQWEVPFGELRSQMETDVQPSQLHYHLQQLVGHFVEKTDNGYHLSSVGIHLFLALRSRAFDRQQDQLSVDANFDCHYCQTPVKGTFDNGWAKIVCLNCEHRYVEDPLDIPLRPNVDEVTALSHFRKYRALRNLLIARGVCPSCAHSLNAVYHSDEDNHPYKVHIDQSCNLCSRMWTQSVGSALLADLGLIAFCYDHGVDVFSTPWWELEFAVTDEHVTVHSTDPWEVALAVTFDGDTLELVVDGDLNVIERNRRDASREGHPSLLSRIQGGACTIGSGGRGDMVILPDNADCLEYLRHHRWSDGVTCPRCERQDTIKKGTTGKDAKRYRCQNCGGTFNDLTGTIFADHRLTLAEMFYIIRQMDETTTAEIARRLDRSSESVSDFVREVRDAQEADTVFGR